jgi:hypothetical protein
LQCRRWGKLHLEAWSLVGGWRGQFVVGGWSTAKLKVVIGTAVGNVDYSSHAFKLCSCYGVCFHFVMRPTISPQNQWRFQRILNLLKLYNFMYCFYISCCSFRLIKSLVIVDNHVIYMLFRFGYSKLQDNVTNYTLIIYWLDRLIFNSRITMDKS